MALNVVIMAAGKGTRMKSALPKVLHRLAGRALVQHVLHSVAGLDAARIIVITGHGAEQVEASLNAPGLRFVRQMPQLGTGHAVLQAVPALASDAGTTLVLNGDVPLIAPATAAALIAASAGERLALLTLSLDKPEGYGRVVRAGGDVKAIVEHKDASAAQLAIHEVYTGVLAAPTALLKRWVQALRNDNVQQEYYLTDVVAMAVSEGVAVTTVSARSETEVMGVNSPHQLAELERRVQREVADTLMNAGVRLADPSRIDVRGNLECEEDVEIDVNCVFEGQVRIGRGTRIGPNCVIRDARIGAGVTVQAFTHIDGVRIGPSASIGPFARLRPGTVLEEDVHVGNFVEIKNSTLAAGAKANHLAYLGDADVGARVNYGAGCITANYDGANKHRTRIGDDAHIGSNSVLVAPVEVGAGATVGGGSTITKGVPAGELAVGRARQVNLSGWHRPRKAAR